MITDKVSFIINANYIFTYTMENKDKKQKRWVQLSCLFLVLTCVLTAGPIKGNAQEISNMVKEEYSALLNQQEISENSVSKEVNLVSLNFSNFGLSGALKMLAEELNIGLAFDAGLTLNKKVTVVLNEVTIYEALENILAGTGLEARIPDSRNMIFIMEKEERKVQQALISGTVTDAQSGETLPGVNVMVRGTTTGTSTDQNGNFELD